MRPPEWLKTGLLIAAAALVGYMILGVIRAAKAGTAEVSWVAPTENTDGSPLTDLAGFKVYYTLGATTQSVTVPGAAVTKYTVLDLAPGLWSFQVTAYNAASVESERSLAATKNIMPDPTGTPTAPVSIQVADTKVYTVIKKLNGFVLTPVGTAPADTVCVATQTVNGYYVVPRAKVKWSGSVKPDVVVGVCR